MEEYTYSNSLITIFVIIVSLFILYYVITIIYSAITGYDNIYGNFTFNTLLSNPNKPPPNVIAEEVTTMALPELYTSGIKSCTTLTNPLSQYAIKASFNSAYSGSYLSKEAIQYIIKRGCRFVDFQVAIINSPDNATKANPTYDPIIVDAKLLGPGNSVLLSKNTMSLDDALMTCITNAFSASNAPNYADPLFIQLRIFQDAPTLDAIAVSIKNTILPKLYTDASTGKAKMVNKDTILNDIMGKIVLLVDTQSLTPVTNIELLKNYTNIFSNTTNWNKYYYSNIDTMPKNPPQINITTQQGTSTTTNVNKLSMMAPRNDNEITIPSPFSVFAEYGIQTLLVPFFSIKNPTLIVYEQLFNTVKGGVVPLATIVSYSNDMLGQI